MSDSTTVPTWLLHFAGWGGGAAIITVLWPGVKWLVGWAKKKLEGPDAATQVNVNVGAAPTAREMESLVEHAIEQALAARPQGAPTSGGGLMAHEVRALADRIIADRVPTDIVTRRELQSIADRVPTDIVTRRDLQVMADRIPIDPVTRREYDELRQRQAQADALQMKFREKMLQRVARIMERFRINLEEERDDNGS